MGEEKEIDKLYLKIIWKGKCKRSIKKFLEKNNEVDFYYQVLNYIIKLWKVNQ